MLHECNRRNERNSSNQCINSTLNNLIFPSSHRFISKRLMEFIDLIVLIKVLYNFNDILIFLIIITFVCNELCTFIHNYDCVNIIVKLNCKGMLLHVIVFLFVSDLKVVSKFVFHTNVIR